jgi:hypothetical protein
MITLFVLGPLSSPASTYHLHDTSLGDSLPDVFLLEYSQATFHSVFICTLIGFLHRNKFYDFGEIAGGWSSGMEKKKPSFRMIDVSHDDWRRISGPGTLMTVLNK